MTMTRSVDGGAGGDHYRSEQGDDDEIGIEDGGDTTCIMAHLHLHHLHPLLGSNSHLRTEYVVGIIVWSTVHTFIPLSILTDPKE